MNRREFLRNSAIAVSALTPIGRAYSYLDLKQDDQGRRFAEGFVFHDRNGSGKRDESDPGIGGICVSNGLEVVKTDRNGKWRLPVDEDSILFVIKPSGWSVPVNRDQLPQYFYIHKPKGSPAYRYSGVAKTGALPSSIDFALRPEKTENKFRMVVFGDPQPRNQTEIDYIAHDVVEQVVRDAAVVGAKFGLSLGDEMFDVLSLYDSLNRTVAKVGLPWYNTVGNHDLNYDAPDNDTSTETFHRIFGPNYYSFNYGKVHFVVLDNVVWHGSTAGGYHGEIPAKQLEFLKNDLFFVPRDRLLVIAMHIPLVDTRNRQDLYRLIEDRPYTFSLSAHTHVQRHYFVDAKEGWNGKQPHHHLNHATVCGSWWEGAPDERGIPHATMSDGAPNGYSIVEFDGVDYRVMFRPASRPEWEQMNIWAPEEIDLSATGATEVIVNVFAGSERSKVEMRINGGEWGPMERFSGQDPYFIKLKEAEAGPKPPAGLKLPNPSLTPHLWRAKLPSRLPVGTHAIDVRTTDMFGKNYSDRRIIRVANSI